MNEKETDKRRLTDPNLSLDFITQHKYELDKKRQHYAYLLQNQMYDQLALMQRKNRRRRENMLRQSVNSEKTQETNPLTRVLKKEEENA